MLLNKKRAGFEISKPALQSNLTQSTYLTYSYFLIKTASIECT
jgi:hypothetical protein